MACSDELSSKGYGVKPVSIGDKATVDPESSVLPETDQTITKGIMHLSERTLARVYENEPDIYTVEDLKVRFR